MQLRKTWNEALSHFSRKRSDAPAAQSFGFAVVGLGRIAECFLRGIAGSPHVHAAALVSGDAAKAASLASRYRVPYTCGYADFDELRHRADVQAVYLALPVSMHRDFTAHAAMAGKHVLVEKPMANTVEDCRAMIADCRAADVLLSVAYRCPHDPLHQRLRALVERGALGRELRIESHFGFALAADDWRYDAALAGGGSLYDVGIYPLNAARFVLGEEPVAHEAKATAAANGMETEIDWTSRFPSGAQAHCVSSYLRAIPNTFRLRGTGGDLLLDPAFTHRAPYRLTGYLTDPATGKRTDIDESTPKDATNQFRMEAEQLAAAARGDAPLLTPGEDGLADMEAMAAIYKAAGLG